MTNTIKKDGIAITPHMEFKITPEYLASKFGYRGRAYDVVIHVGIAELEVGYIDVSVINGQQSLTFRKTNDALDMPEARASVSITDLQKWITYNAQAAAGRYFTPQEAA